MACPRFYHAAIECHPAIEVRSDAEQHRAVLFESVGIVGGHHATRTQLRCVNFDGAESDSLPFPLALRQSFHSTDENVRAKAAAVEADCLDSSIGCHQQRQHVKVLRTGDPNQLYRLSGSLCCQLASRGLVPRNAVDSDFFALGVDAALEAQQSMMSSGTNDPLPRD